MCLFIVDRVSWINQMEKNHV
uniref:Uncharacterized protein n=1 Tax=Arundo donax TaxID=35708 RepID=A0A0A9HMZ7_ARUDO